MRLERAALGIAMGVLLGATVLTARYVVPADHTVAATTAVGNVEAGARRGEQIPFARDGDWWGGRIGDLPPGSVVRVHPRGLPGFFLVAGDGGRTWAVADRNPYRSQRLEWRETMPEGARKDHGMGGAFWSWDGVFSLEGQVLSGPPPGPLERFAVELADGWARIATLPACPDRRPILPEAPCRR
jgi:hypothetical protein